MPVTGAKNDGYGDESNAGISGVKRFSTALALAITSLCVVILLAEAGIRIFSPQDLGYFDSRSFRRVDAAPPHFIENIPGGEATFIGVPVRINGAGLRGEEVVIPKPPQVVRILAVGDSVTFGYGVRVEDTYEKVLEDLLNRKAPHPPRYEVINGGTLGGSLADYLHFLEQKADALQPDVVLIGLCLNDILVYHDPPAKPLGAAKAGSEPRVSVRQLNHFLLRHSQLYMLVYAGLKAFSYRVGLIDMNKERGLIALQPPSIQQAQAWASSFDMLSRLSDFCKQRGYRMMVVAFPMQMQMSAAELQWYRDNYRLNLGDGALSGDPQRRLHDFGDAHGITLVDLLPAYRAHDAKLLYIRNKMIASDPVHPSVMGDRVAAEEIFRSYSFRGQEGSID